MRSLLFAVAMSAAVLSTGVGHAQENPLEKYCKADIERLCSGIEPGGGRLLECLKAHTQDMSVGCAQALKKLKG